MDLTDADTIERILKEDGVDPMRALTVLVQAIVGQRAEWHSRECADTVLGEDGMPMWTGGCASVALFRYLKLASHDNRQIYEAQVDDGPDADAEISDGDYVEGLISGAELHVQEMLMDILDECIERADAIDEQTGGDEQEQGDEDEPPIREAA